MAANKIHVGMGEGVVAAGPLVVLSPGIGSCVVVTLYDPGRKVGGLAHVMLPDSARVHGSRPPYHCADTALAALLEELRNHRARQHELVAKIVGGAQMFASYNNGSAGIGAENLRSIKDLLEREAIPLVGWDIAGQHGRTVEFHLTSGRLVVKALGKEDKQF
jgi:chemotaxis protein CheD